MRKRSKYKPRPTTYSLAKQLIASPTEPMSAAETAEQIGKFRSAVVALRTGTASREDWENCADCVNLLETLVTLVEIDDAGGWIKQASTELALAAHRSMTGQGLRLSPEGIVAFENAIEGYEAAVTQLPSRRMVEVHRLTEIRVREIRLGRGLAHDVQVVSL